MHLELDSLSFAKLNLLDSAGYLPVRASSMHPLAVHRFWRLSEVQRLFMRSQTTYDFDKFLDLKLNHWSTCFMISSLLKEVRSWTPRNFARTEPVSRPLIIRIILP